MSSIEVQVSSGNVESKRRGRPRREGAVVCSGDELVERLACVSVDVGGDGVRESVECGLMGNEEVCGVVLREEKEKEEVKKEKALAREELKKEKAAMKEEAKAAAKAARELAKKEEKEVKEQMKEEVKKEKEEAKAAAKLAKEEAKAAAKAAKAEERAASKAAAKAEKAAQKSATKKTKNTKNTKKTLTPTSRDTAKVEDTEAELEPEMSVEVRMFEHEGTPYLKDDAGALYSADTHEELGMWDATTQKIELRKQPSTGYVREGDELCDP